MELIEVILSKENLNRAYKKVVANKGAGGVDGVTVEELGKRRLRACHKEDHFPSCVQMSIYKYGRGQTGLWTQEQF